MRIIISLVFLLWLAVGPAQAYDYDYDKAAVAYYYRNAISGYDCLEVGYWSTWSGTVDDPAYVKTTLDKWDIEQLAKAWEAIADRAMKTPVGE